MRDRHLHLLLAFCSIAAFFILLETALALFWPHKLVDRPFYHEQYHPLIGWVNDPSVDGDYHLTRTTTYHRHHNAKGLRSMREIPYEKPSGTKRVLLLGDSFIWGYGVNDGDILSEVLQRDMGPDVEIVNGAAPGYGTDQELLWLVEEGVKYRPELVVLFFYAANDWQEISQSISYGLPAYPKPYFYLDKGRLVATNIPVPDTRETRREAFDDPVSLFEKAKKFLRYHTHTYPFLAKRLNSAPAIRTFLLRTGLAKDFTALLHNVPVLTHRMEEILPLSEALIKEIRRVSNIAGADFLIVLIPEKERSPGAPPVYENILPGAEIRNTEASRYMTRFTAQNKMRFLDLLPPVRERQARGELLYVPQAYDHHWTPAGHRAVAELLFDWLKKNFHSKGSSATTGPGKMP